MSDSDFLGLIDGQRNPRTAYDDDDNDDDRLMMLQCCGVVMGMCVVRGCGTVVAGITITIMVEMSKLDFVL